MSSTWPLLTGGTTPPFLHMLIGSTILGGSEMATCTAPWPHGYTSISPKDWKLPSCKRVWPWPGCIYRKVTGDIHVSTGRQNHDIHHMFGIINYLYLNMGTESLCSPFCWIGWDFVPLHFRSFLALPIVRVSLFYNFLNSHSCKVHILVHIFSLAFGMVNLFTPLSHLYMQPKRPSYSKIKITLGCEMDQK